MHTAMRLVAYVLLLVAGVLWLSYVRGSGETAAERLDGLVPVLEEAGYHPYPGDAPAVETLTGFEDHWLQEYAPEIFEGVESIHLLNVKADEPVGLDRYPEAVVEVWVYGSDARAERAVAVLDSLGSGSWAFRAPGEWWSQGDILVYAHTRDEMFRPQLEEIADMLRESL